MSEKNLIEWIKKELAARDWSIRELGRRSKISHAYIADILKGNKPITLKFCKAIAEGFNEPVWRIFLISGLLNDAPASLYEDENVKLVVRMFSELSLDQQKEALNYLRWLHSRTKGE